MMKTTLFEILMDKARILEKKDGIKRVITLNSQFRMHPELGNIVSNYFYKMMVAFHLLDQHLILLIITTA